MIYWCVEGGIAIGEFFTLKIFAHTYGVRFIIDVVLFVAD
jgi:hypothetical protein